MRLSLQQFQAATCLGCYWIPYNKSLYRRTTSLLLRALITQRGCHALRLNRAYYLSKGTQEPIKVVLG
jgi:hypothetical protein